MSWLRALLAATATVACVGQPAATQDLALVFESVCRGQPVTAADRYPDAGAPHRIVRIGHSFPSMPFAWQASLVDNTQLVSCAEVETEALGACHYTTRSLNRLRFTLHVTLRSARTAQVIDRVSLVGDTPPVCPPTILEQSILGSPPDQALSDWLEPFITGTDG